MTPERFRALLQAYGADSGAGPTTNASAARALAAQESAELRRRWPKRRSSTRWLDAHVARGTRAMRWCGAIVAADCAGTGRSRARRRRLPGRWWPGAGLTLTGLAGALAGALLVSVALRQAVPSASIDWQARGTAFGELAADGSDE